MLIYADFKECRLDCPRLELALYRNELLYATPPVEVAIASGHLAPGSQLIRVLPGDAKFPYLP
jgi:hypothetical protein